MPFGIAHGAGAHNHRCRGVALNLGSDTRPHSPVNRTADKFAAIHHNAARRVRVVQNLAVNHAARDIHSQGRVQLRVEMSATSDDAVRNNLNLPAVRWRIARAEMDTRTLPVNS